MTDTRIAYGARCTWWDGIANVGLTEPGLSGHRLPCCPHCGSMLFEMESEEPWWAGARKHEANGNPGYVDMLRWARGKCFPNMTALQLSYADDTMVRETLPRAADFALAESIIDSSPVINVFAANEWQELTEDGQAWCAAIVAEASKRARAELPADVVELVIAAREFWGEFAMQDSEYGAALDKALEAFAERVPFADQPEDPDRG